MNSYISSFKTFFFGFTLIIVYELFIYIFLGHPSIYESNLFERHLIKPDNRAAFVVATKIEQALKKDYKYIQIGGSGGLHGIKPKFISDKYFNASCCRNTGVDGYGIIGKFIISELNNRYGAKERELVYVLSPLSFPHESSSFSNSFTKTLYENFSSSKGKALNRLPSQNLRPPFKSSKLSYESIKLDSVMTLEGMESGNDIYSFSHDNSGYIPFFEKTKLEYPPKNYFPEVLTQKDNFIRWVEEIAMAGKNLNYKFVIVILPFPLELKEKDMKIVYEVIKEVKKINNVTILTEFLNDKRYQDDSIWGDNVHMAPAGATLFSKELAKLFL